MRDDLSGVSASVAEALNEQRRQISGGWSVEGKTKLAGVLDLKEGEIVVAEVDGEPVVVCKIDGEFHAIGGVCPHAMGPLGDGHLVDGQAECPWHGSRFDLKSGGVTKGPATEASPRYHVDVDGEEIVLRHFPTVPARRPTAGCDFGW